MNLARILFGNDLSLIDYISWRLPSVMSTDKQAAHRTRRGNVRSAHHASATRFMNQIDVAIESKNTCQLKQLKQSLTDKLSVLMKLHDELIELVEESDLEAEVEQAGETRQRIGLGILNIEDALAAQSHNEGKDTCRTGSWSGADSSSTVSGGKDDHPATSHTLSSHPVSHPVITTSISSSLVPA